MRGQGTMPWTLRTVHSGKTVEKILLYAGEGRTAGKKRKRSAQWKNNRKAINRANTRRLVRCGSGRDARSDSKRREGAEAS